MCLCIKFIKFIKPQEIKKICKGYYRLDVFLYLCQYVTYTCMYMVHVGIVSFVLNVWIVTESLSCGIL